jgi:putative membrane protein
MIGWVLIALIAALHVYIMVLEMALWESPRAMKAFGTTPEFAAKSKVLAANQGLYNGFLAAGLLWALIAGVPGEGRALALFFLGCVFVAGLYGAATANKRILFVQSVPAGLAILAVWLGW